MKPQIIVASHRRSGTHLAIDTITNNFPQFSNSIPADEAFFEQFRGEGGKERFKRAQQAVLEKSNVLWTHIHDLNNVDGYFENDPEVAAFTKELIKHSKIIYVYRDGRDVMTSMYAWMKAIGYTSDSLSFSDFIRENNNWDATVMEKTFNRVEFWQHHLDCWMQHESVLKLSFEDFIQDFNKCLSEIADYTGYEIRVKITNSRRKPLLGFIPYGKWTLRLYKYIIAPLKGEKSQAHYFRKGISGDYKIHFSEDDIEFFEQQAGTMLSRINNMEIIN